MEDKKRQILNQVRTGTITAEEGAARLDELASENAAGTATRERPAPAALQPAPNAASVKVVSQFGSAEVVADPTVATAVAEGPHRVRLDGNTMVIEHIEINGFDFKTRRGLKVRMHPDLPLFASVQAGSLRVDGVHGPITAEVQAGSCNVNDFRGPINVVAQAGSVTASGCIDSGTSKVRCEMGSIRLSLNKQSSVKITARTTMGKVAIDDESGEHAIAGSGGKEVTIGSGAATLDIEGTMGNVRISVG